MKKVYATLAIICMIILIGTAGANDLETISIGHAVIQGTLSLAGFYVFAKQAGAFERSFDND